jgi:hypothetical protein
MMRSTESSNKDTEKDNNSSENSTILIDMNRKEEVATGPGSVVIVTIAIMPNSDRTDTTPNIVWTICDTGRISNMDVMDGLISHAINGCLLLFEQIQIAVREHALRILSSRGGGNPTNNNSNKASVVVTNALVQLQGD